MPRPASEPHDPTAAEDASDEALPSETRAGAADVPDASPPDAAPRAEFDEDENPLVEPEAPEHYSPEELEPDEATLTEEGEPDLNPEETPAPEPGDLPDLPEPDELDETESASAAEMEVPALLGERVCPLCDGAGSLPYGVLPSSRSETCGECGGIGQVTTGSLVSASAVIDCEACNGAGYVAKQSAPTPILPAGAPPSERDAPPWPGAVWNPQTGAWGIAGAL